MLKRSRRRFINEIKITYYVMKLKLITFPTLFVFVCFQAAIFLAFFTLNTHRQHYFRDTTYQEDSVNLRATLNAFRFLFLSLNANTNAANLIANESQDFLFNKNFYVNLSDQQSIDSLKAKKFYKPKILVNKKGACQNTQPNVTLVLCMIHSDRKNTKRREVTRKTWLSMSDFGLNEANSSFKLVHLFIVGASSGINEKNQNKLLENEARIYNDIIMIDTPDIYHNLVYKHLALINWVLEYCTNADYVIKLDDDVYVNIKPILTHLVDKFGAFPKEAEFIYCNNIEMASPVRNTSSKWFVNTDEYPFKFYPRYCEGFSYITNVPTIRLMREQSNLIPRFWIDDIYVTGLLLNGLEPRVKWFDYSNVVTWSYYDYWDLALILSPQLSVVDFYSTDFFVVIHETLSYKNRFKTQHLNDKIVNLMADLTSSEMASKRRLTPERVDFYFYKFCQKMFENTSLI